MAKRCSITGKGVQTGNNVSHSNRKSRRRFMPNIQRVTFFSEALNMNVRLRVTVHTIRSIDHNGGLDKFLLKTSSLKLTPEAVTLKRRIQRAIKAKDSAAPAAAAPAAQAA